MGRLGEGSENSAGGVSGLDESGHSQRPEEIQAVAERSGQPTVQDEAGESVKVHILVPARDIVYGWFAYSLALATAYISKHAPEVEINLIFNNGTILSEQRHALAKIAMLDGADWTVWFDTDMRFPKDTIYRLLMHKQPIVCAGYPTRKPPLIEPTQYSDDADTRFYTEKDSTGLQEIASTGFGCVAVHRSVFEAMEPPWFHIPWLEDELRHDCGEDIYFCRKARQAGFKVLLDHDLSKEIAHIGQYEFTYREALATRPKIEEIRANRK
jgi:hypothetical protein